MGMSDKGRKVRLGMNHKTGYYRRTKKGRHVSTKGEKNQNMYSSQNAALEREATRTGYESHNMGGKIFVTTITILRMK